MQKLQKYKLYRKLNLVHEKLVKTTRSYEWWDYKIPLALFTAYTLTWIQHLHISTLYPAFILIFLSGITAGTYASIINDVTDLEEDRLVGKITGYMALSRKGRFLALAACFSGGIITAYLLRHYHYSLLCYITIWVVYSLYSIKPIRLKERGGWGIISVAVGEHVLAATLSLLLVWESVKCTIPIPWLISLMIWSVALGCRGILWHQLCDYENDKISNTKTLSSKYEFSKLSYIGARILFPTELTGLASFLYFTHNYDLRIFLISSVFFEWLRYRFMATNIVLSAPAPNQRFALFEYYQLFMPMAILYSLYSYDRGALFVFIVHSLLFPLPLIQFISHAIHLIRWELWPFIITRPELPEG